MSVRVKLLVIVTFVALVPLGFLAYTTLGLHQQALDQKISEVHVRSAKYGASLIESNLERAVLGLKPTIEHSIDWSSLNPREQEGALWLLLGQLPSIVQVALLDAQGHTLVASSSADPPGTAQTPERERQRLKLLAAGLSVERVVARGFARGTPVRNPEDGGWLVPVGFPVHGADGTLVVMIGLDLAAACAELAYDKLERAAVMLLDGNKRTLCAYPSGVSDAPVEAGLSDQLSNGQRANLRYVRTDGTEMLAAAAATPWGFYVVVAQPLRVAFAPSARMRLESLLWLAIGAASAVGAGLVLSRGITRPLLRLSRGAELVAQGDFGVRLTVDGSDELSGVSASFNRMCGEIEAREREIRGWNEELRARVEEKTGELKAAQNALLESRKLSAMSALAAGVAHEINNPLTGVIGLTQILLSRSKKRAGAEPEAELLQSIEREALRVRDIVSKMLLLSDSGEGSGHHELRLLDVVRNAINDRRSELQDAGIAVEEQVAAGVPNILGDHAKLIHVLLELIENARKAMRDKPGKLVLALDSIDGELVRLRVSDTGRGVAPEHIDQVFEPFFTTKDDWQGQGLGLAVVYRIVEAHHGSIKLESKPGEGTTVTMILPAKRHGAHLA